MFALSAYIRFQDGTGKFHDGTLHRLPAELRDQPRLAAYAKINEAGWGVLEFGYHYYAHSTPTGDLLIFPGLIIAGATSPRKKFHGYNQTWTREQIREFASGVSQFSNGVIDSAQQDMNILVHDLRALSSAIYNSALEAEQLLDKGNYLDAKIRIETVLASQGMLKMRTDALDFIGNPASVIQNRNIQPFKKIDKVVRCFRSSAAYQNKKLHLAGTSFRTISGPDIFELIPYIMIDNAIKYSPIMYPIEVKVWEDAKFNFHVESYGPFISVGEREEIFAKGVRGRAAVESGIPGSGVGLHLLKRLAVQHFGGDIAVIQSVDSDFVDGRTYHRTKFVVQVPMS